MRKALIVVDLEDGVDRIVDPILKLASRADIVILARNGTQRTKTPTALRRVVDYIVTKGIDGRPTYSAFDGGTLRPIESLEEILTREKVSDVVICGCTLRTVVSQTAFDARALGYSTTVCFDATVMGGEILGPMEKLQKADIDIQDSNEIWI